MARSISRRFSSSRSGIRAEDSLIAVDHPAVAAKYGAAFDILAA
jgi:hypothetical protein